MSRYFFILGLCLVCGLSYAQPADSPWPMYQHDAQQTGRTDVAGPTSPHLDWIYEFEFVSSFGARPSLPVIDEDTTIYVLSEDTLFYALYPSGIPKWICGYTDFPIRCPDESSPLIGDEHIYFVDYKNLNILNKDGTIYWQSGWEYWWEPALIGSPIMADNGMIYVVGDTGSYGNIQNRLYAISQDTLFDWFRPLSVWSVGCMWDAIPSIGYDGTIYVAYDSIYAINPNGTRKWSLNRTATINADCASIGPDGTIYSVGGWNDSIVAISPSGEIQWEFYSYKICTKAPSIGADGTIYFVSGNVVYGGDGPTRLFAVNPAGESLYVSPFRGEPTQGAQIAIAQNMMYIACNYHYEDTESYAIYGLTLDGELKWRYALDYRITGIAIAPEAVVGTYEYSSTDSVRGFVFAIKEGNYAIQLLSPNGGENLPASQPDTIRWSSQNVDSVSLYYTLEGSDNIVDYTPIVEKIPDTGEYIWQPPDTSCSSVRVAVIATDSRGNILSIDMSDSNFTIDNTHPESCVDSLPRFINSLSFEITWQGYDPGDGAGLDYFDVQYKDGDGSWMDWITETTDTAAIFTGQENHKYYFRCRGVDESGNVEPYPDYDTYTYIDITQPTITDVSPADDGLAGSQPVIHAVIGDPSPGSGLVLDSLKVIFDDSLVYHYRGRVTYDDYTGEVGMNWYWHSLDYGDHTMTISVMDSATNWFSVTRNFKASWFVDKKWELVGNMGRLGGDDTSSLYDESETEDYLFGLIVDDEGALERLCLGEDVMYKLERWTRWAVEDFMLAFTDLKILSDGCVDNIRRQVEVWTAEDSVAYADSIESATETAGRIVDDYEDFIDLGISIVDEYYGTGFGDVKTIIGAMYDLTSPNDDEIIYQFRQIATRIVMNSFLRITQPSLDDILNNAITHNFTGTYGEAQQATGGLMDPEPYPDGSVLKIYKDWYTAADDSIQDYIWTAHTFEWISWLFGVFGLPVGDFDFGAVFEKWSDAIATLEYLRAMQVALRYYVGVADTSTGGIRDGTILSFFPDSSVSKASLCGFIPWEVIEKFKDKFRDAKDDYETCLLHIQQLVDNGEVDSVRLLLPTLVELDRQYSFQSRIAKAPILAVSDTAYAEDTGFADELFDLHSGFVNSNSERYRVNRFIRGFLGDSTYVDSVDAQVPMVIAINDTLEGMTSALLDSISSYPASPIVLPSYYQVRDRVSLGDTLSLHASIINGGAGVAHNVRVRLITPSEINITGENEFYIGDLESGEEVEVTWSLMCREAGGPVSLMIAPRADNGKFMSKTVNITTEYTIAPEIGGVTVDSQLIEPYDYVVINAYVTGIKPVSSVYAIITRPGESYIQQVRLYDDGHHYDGEAGDHLYGIRWRTPNYERDYYVSISAEDQSDNTRTRGNVVGFTSKEFDKESGLLLVNDNLDRYEIVNDDTTIIGEDIESYCRNSLDNLGHNYDIWRTICRGAPPDTILELYRKDGCVIWANGIYERSAISSLEAQNAIKWYLGREGRFFISGQDIGWGLTHNGSESSDLFENYLYTSFVLDDSRDFDLDGVAGDSITDGLSISVSGGDGANNQRYPDVIEPSGDAVSIFNYSPGNSGGIRKDRLVYLSFGFEAINSEADRDTILARMLQCFGYTGVEDGRDVLIPSFAVYPNPARRNFDIYLAVPTAQKEISFGLYDISGRLLREMKRKNTDPGAYTISWDVSNMPSGVYFIKVKTSFATYNRKIILMR